MNFGWVLLSITHPRILGWNRVEEALERNSKQALMVDPIQMWVDPPEKKKPFWACEARLTHGQCVEGPFMGQNSPKFTSMQFLINLNFWWFFFFFGVLEIFICTCPEFKLNRNTWYSLNFELEIFRDAYYIYGHIIFYSLPDLRYFDDLNNFESLYVHNIVIIDGLCIFCFRSRHIRYLGTMPNN